MNRENFIILPNIIISTLFLLAGCGRTEDNENRRLQAEVEELKMEIESLRGSRVNGNQESDQTNPQFDPSDRTGGIGATLNNFSGLLTIRSIVRDLPCAKAGIIPGDKILKIDGKDTKEMNMQVAIAHLRGPTGKKISLTIRELKTGNIKEIELVRARIIPIPTDKLILKGISLGMKLEEATKILNKTNPALDLAIKKTKKGDRNEVNNGGVWLVTDADGKIIKIDFSRSACDKVFNTKGLSHRDLCQQISIQYHVPMRSFNRKRKDLIGEIGKSRPRSNDLLPRIGFIVEATEYGWEYHNVKEGWIVSISHRLETEINSGDTNEIVPSSYLVIKSMEKPKFD